MWTRLVKYQHCLCTRRPLSKRRKLHDLSSRTQIAVIMLIWVGTRRNARGWLYRDLSDVSRPPLCYYVYREIFSAQRSHIKWMLIILLIRTQSQAFSRWFRETFAFGKNVDCQPSLYIRDIATLPPLEYLRTVNIQNYRWNPRGIVSRLSLRMRYNWDESNSRSITPFEAEMRRRTWAVIHNVNCSVSVQFGQPRMIQLRAYGKVKP